jgi:hypothetical protein
VSHARLVCHSPTREDRQRLAGPDRLTVRKPLTGQTSASADLTVARGLSDTVAESVRTVGGELSSGVSKLSSRSCHTSGAADASCGCRRYWSDRPSATARSAHADSGGLWRRRGCAVRSAGGGGRCDTPAGCGRCPALRHVRRHRCVGPCTARGGQPTRWCRSFR